MDFIESICRDVCIIKKIDPDKEGFGMGHTMPKGSTYRLWEAQREIVEFIISQVTPYA